MKVFVERTPNPESLKFRVEEKISDETHHFEEPQQAYFSPLASKLFHFPWVDKISIGPHYITINKQDWVDWESLKDPLEKLILEHLQSKEPVIKNPPKFEDETDENDTESVRTIKKVLNERIRPLVARDGGDITFSKYENQVLFLNMKGACSGCPSAEATLKYAVEEELKRHLPEIKEIVSS